MLHGIWRVAAMTALVPGAIMGQGPARPKSKPVAPHAATPTVLVLAATGNEVRFTVREQLTIFASPNDAIGTTRAIAGGITLLSDGRVDPAHSTITVAMDSLRTDKENRDSWIKSHTLRTDSFPTAVIVVKELRGLPATLPASGTVAFTVIGDLTIHGVTKPWTWDATLTANGNDYTGTATTHIRFGDFGMEQPRLMIVISVIDDVKLQYDFHLTKSGGR